MRKLTQICGAGLFLGLFIMACSAFATLGGNVVTWTPTGSHYTGLLSSNTIAALLNQPRGLTNMIAVAAGAAHNLALRDDGTIVAWGDNSLGQTNVPLDLTNVIAIAAGGNRSLAVKSDGTVVGWGDISVPTLTNIVAVSAGPTHCLGVRNDGSVVAWGENNFGELNVPVGLSNVLAVAAGGHTSLALLNNGAVVGWGVTDFVPAPSDLSNVVAISLHDSHALALHSDGTLSRLASPYDLSLYLWPGDLVSVAAGGAFDMAMCGNSTVSDNSFLPGLGPTSPWNTPLTQQLTNVLSIAVGDAHYVAITRMPVILRSPTNQTTYPFGEVSLDVVFESPVPVTLQWFSISYDSFGNSSMTAIPGATNSVFTLQNVSASHAGDYVVVLSNVYGIITSTLAHVTLTPGPPLNRIYNEALDTNGNVNFWFAYLTNSPGFDIQSSTNFEQWELAQAFGIGAQSSDQPYITIHATIQQTNGPLHFYRLKAR